MKETDDKYLNALEFARKIEANSWERMWNDAVKASYPRGFFYFNPPTYNTTEVTETGKKIMKEMLEHFNLNRDGNEIKTNNNETI